jgi:hypothetical protein
MSSLFNTWPLNKWSQLGTMLVVWIVLAAVGTTTAAASCGDYLHAVPDQFHSSVTEHPSSTVPDPAPAVPCSGPSCRRGPATPESPHPIDLRLTLTDRLIIDVRTFSLFDSAQGHVRTDDAVAIPDGYRTGLERPPRAV